MGKILLCLCLLLSLTACQGETVPPTADESAIPVIADSDSAYEHDDTSVSLDTSASPTPIDTNPSQAGIESPTPSPTANVQRFDLMETFLDQAENPDTKGELTALLAGRSRGALSPEEDYNAQFLEFCLAWQAIWNQESTTSTVPYTPLPFGQQVVVDLNGDGLGEAVTVSLTDLGDSPTVRISVNETEFFYKKMDEVEERYYIIDLDPTDGFKEIAISSQTSTDSENVLAFFAFDGEKIFCMNEQCNSYLPMLSDVYREWRLDKIEGSFEALRFSGNGAFTTTQPAAILQYWFYPLTYRLTEEHRLRAVSELYPVNYPVFTRQAIPLYPEPSMDGAVFQVPAGTSCRLTALDDVAWVQVTTNEGVSGWLHISGEGLISDGTKEYTASELLFLLSIDG